MLTVSKQCIIVCFTTLCPKKRSHFCFWNNSVTNELILIIFGALYPEGTHPHTVATVATVSWECQKSRGNLLMSSSFRMLCAKNH